MQNEGTKTEEHLIRPLDEKPQKKNKYTGVIVLVYVLLILAGIGTGFLLSANTPTSSANSINIGNTMTDEAGMKKETLDESCPVGTIESGGIDGEGTHKLIRSGGPSQTAYLTSSVVDLDEYIGKSVQVCGQTMQAKKAGWLMDVEAVSVQ